MSADVIRLDRQRGGFFAADARVWEALCRCRSINMAVAYLVMARGTGHDNRTTSWSTNAIEQRTSISRPQAKLAISGLIERSFVRVEKRGTRPRYALLPAHEVPGTPVYRRRAKPKQQAEPKPDWIWLPNRQSS